MFLENYNNIYFELCVYCLYILFSCVNYIYAYTINGKQRSHETSEGGSIYAAR